jgi:Glucose dehydrogenase
MVNKLTSIVLAILALALLYMGGKLLMLGGSAFYALMAVGLLITAILLFRNQRSALALYAVLMWITLAWIIWEVGFDKWQWIPRGDLFGVIGLWLAMPWVVKPLYQGERRFHTFLGGTVIVMIVVVIGLCFYDPLPQAGTISNAREQASEQGAANDWTAYGGTTDGQRFSSLNQITKENVQNLEVAWTYHTGDLRQDADASEYTFEATPVKANGMLYFCTPHNEVHALDPETGAVKWKYTPNKDRSYLQQHQTCRGVSYYEQSPVARRILLQRRPSAVSVSSTPPPMHS